MRSLTRKETVLVVIFGTLGLGFMVLIFPWILIGIGFALEDASKERAHRNYVPRNLAEAARFDLATPAMVTAFLDKGEKVDQMVDLGDGHTVPLIRAATASGTVEVARLLIKRGAKVDQAGLWSVLRGGKGKEEMARMLIEEGAPLTGPQPDADLEMGAEPIQAAVMGHQAWAVKLLLEKGADKRVRNQRGEGLLDLSVENESMDNSPISNSLETTRVLLAAGGLDLNAKGLGEHTPLDWTAEHGKLDEARLLLDAGARVEGPPGRAYTPLGVAVAHCRPETAALLLSRGASRAGKTDNNLPLREGACYGGYPEESDRKKIAELLR